MHIPVTDRFGPALWRRFSRPIRSQGWPGAALDSRERNYVIGITVLQSGSVSEPVQVEGQSSKTRSAILAVRRCRAAEALPAVRIFYVGGQFFQAVESSMILTLCELSLKGTDSDIFRQCDLLACRCAGRFATVSVACNFLRFGLIIAWFGYNRFGNYGCRIDFFSFLHRTPGKNAEYPSASSRLWPFFAVRVAAAGGPRPEHRTA